MIRVPKYTLPILTFGLICVGCEIRTPRSIAVIPETTGTELWEAAHAGAELAGYEEGYKIYWNAPTRRDDVEGQIALVERAIKKHQSGIVLAPDHFLALLTVVQDAEASQIPIAVIRSPLPIPESANLTYIVNDDNAMGRMAADRIGVVLHGSGEIAMIGIDPNVSGVLLRSQAFELTLKLEYPGIVVVDRKSSSDNPVEIQSIAEEVLRNHPDLDGIVAFNTISTEGSWAALNTYHRTGKVRLIGCDQEIDLMAGIRHGDIDSVLVEDTYDMGKLAVEWIAERQKGAQKSQQKLLLPVLVTKANIDDASIQRLLSANWRVQR